MNCVIVQVTCCLSGNVCIHVMILPICSFITFFLNKGRDFLCRGQAEFQPIVIELYIELEIFLQEVNRIVPQKRGGFAEIKLLGLVRFVKTPIHQDRNRGLFVRAMVAGASWVVRRRL